MADLAKRLPDNADGLFFVDSTCIDCGTCRWVAPASFDKAGDKSRVHAQPPDADAVRAAGMALLACPVAAIGTDGKTDLTPARDAFTAQIGDGPVFYLGYHSRKSFGAASYLIQRPAGNILVDSPRFAGPVVKALEALGGVHTMVLTHMDDVADHRKFAEQFGCERIIHKADVRRRTAVIERQIEEFDPVDLTDDLTLIPVPGHTEGSMCLLFDERFLFTGDHLAWSPTLGHLHAFRSACWFDWDRQKESMARLQDHRFDHVLPGHGWPWHGSAEEAQAQLQRCLTWMAQA